MTTIAHLDRPASCLPLAAMTQPTQVHLTDEQRAALDAAAAAAGLTRARYMRQAALRAAGCPELDTEPPSMAERARAGGEARARVMEAAGRGRHRRAV